MPRNSLPRSRRVTSRAVSRPVSNSVLQQVHETHSIPIQTTAGGVCSTLISAIQPSGLVLAARLAGYQAIFDECRIDFIKVTISPLYGSNTRGRVCVYVERDPAAAIVATVDLANDQREKVFGSLYTPLSIGWRPQEPTDHAFNPLNPGTVSLGSLFFKADSLLDGAGAAIAQASTISTVTIQVAMTLRGRP